MDNLFNPIDGVIIKIASQENSVVELTEEAKTKNIGEIISPKSYFSEEAFVKLFGASDKEHISDGTSNKEHISEMYRIFAESGSEADKEKIKVRFTEGYPLKDLGNDIYYVKFINIIGIYN